MNENKSKKWCKYHKSNKSHNSIDCIKLKSKKKSNVTKDCRYLKNLKKTNISKVDECQTSSDSDSKRDEDFASFHSINAINPYKPTVNSFASVDDTHPLATSEPLMTCLNVEGIFRCKF